MMEPEPTVANFIKYNNAVPIAIGLIFLGAGGTFAATNPDAIYSTTQTVQSVDNTYITNVDIESYPFKVGVTSVTEDDENYYVTYTLGTIDIVDYVWQDVLKKGSMSVSKAMLRGRDLGLYVEKDLADLRNSEKRRLLATQEIERTNGITQKTIATAYSGLVGKFISPKNEEFPGYRPVAKDPTAKGDPLALKTPVESNTYDAADIARQVAALQAANQGTGTTSTSTGSSTPTFTDLCPEVPGIQLSAQECQPVGTSTPPQETGTTTPPEPAPEPESTSTPPAPESPTPEPAPSTEPAPTPPPSEPPAP